MLFALDELESNYYAEVEYSKDDMSDHQNIERLINPSVGLISQISDEEYILGSNTSEVSTDENFNFSKILVLSYQDSKPKLSNIYGDSETTIKSFLDDNIEIFQHFEAIYKYSDLYHLINQLKKYGLDIRFDEDNDDNHYVLTSINKKQLSDKQGQMKKHWSSGSSEEGQAYHQQQEQEEYSDQDEEENLDIITELGAICYFTSYCIYQIFYIMLVLAGILPPTN